MKFFLPGISVCLLCVLSARGQGSLTPPGPPAEMFKTLDQVEPRTPITNIPFNITQPGSYYLTGSFTGVAGTNGITILTSGVSLDLKGHILTGVPGSADGIQVAAGRKTISIQNGIVRYWGGDGVDAGAASVGYVMVKDIQAISNGVDGIRFISSSAALDCLAIENGANGFSLVSNAGLFRNCLAFINKANGFFLDTTSAAYDCVARDNFDDGFEIAGGCVLRNCTSVANNRAGIRVTGPGSLVINCSATASGAEGICVVARNTYVYGNNCHGNGNAGVHSGILVSNFVNSISTGNRIDSNHLNDNDVGIQVLSPSNIVVRNSVSGSLIGPNYTNVPGNSIGQITNVAGIGSFNVSNPWANFEF
jgi:hypothetical protein